MIKVRDVAFVRFSAPDLDAMQQFGLDFGLTLTHRDDESLYLRGTDASPYCHVTRLGEPGFDGVAFEAASAEDLQAAARLDGASGVEKLDGPGGGQVVRFTDPDGFAIEVVHGREELPKLEARTAFPLNTGRQAPRLGDLQRVPGGPGEGEAARPRACSRRRTTGRARRGTSRASASSLRTRSTSAIPTTS